MEEVGGGTPRRLGQDVKVWGHLEEGDRNRDDGHLVRKY